MHKFKEHIQEGLGRGREDDEYHVPDPVAKKTHKITLTVSHPSTAGGQRHKRDVTISNTTKSEYEARIAAKHHLQSKGYTIHESLNEGAYEKAEEHLSKANDAEREGRMKDFHAHMADHHDAMSEWHDSKGRSASADKHAEKADMHHEKAMALKESVELEEAVKIGSKVKMHAPGKDYHDQVGHVAEIRHGAFKGAAKTYTVDYADGKSVQLDKKNIKLHKESVDLDEVRRANTASARAELANRPRKPESDKEKEDKKKESDAAWERLMAHAAAQNAKKANEEAEQIDELKDTTLISYAQKVHDDSLKHDKDPSKRSAEKRNKSVMGFSRAVNKLEARPQNVKEEIEPDYCPECMENPCRCGGNHLDESALNELTSDLLQKYKDKAMKSAADLAAKGNYKKSNDRLMNHMKATGKQIDKTTAGIAKALKK